MELQDSGTGYQWVYVSMDAFTGDLYKIGVPTADRATTLQRYVDNMNVYASANANVTTVTGISTGNIEFWPSNYGTGNNLGIPNASSSEFDCGDSGFNTTAGHGSMQIHNHAISQTIMAMNQFGSNNRTPAMGIGNNTNLHSTPDPDWTFRSNANSYSIKNIYVMVRDAVAVPTGTLEILNQPQSKRIRTGESASMSIYAPDAFTYQWRKDGVWIPGAINSWLEFSDAIPTDSSDYDVIVFAEDGSYVISDSAELTVVPTGTTLILR